MSRKVKKNIVVPPSKSGGGGVGGNRAMRIPATLQAVFLASNRGKDVHKPPPERVAAKVFFRKWSFLHGGGRGGASSGGSNHAKEAAGPVIASAPHCSLDKKKGTESNKVAVPETLVMKSTSDMCPQTFLESMMASRGYSTKHYKTKESAYYNKPTPLQLASYDVYLIQLVRQGKEDAFREIMSSGISPNPCNTFGESLLHMVCRRGDLNLVQIMVNNGSDLQVADDYGRTPLHDACWAPRPCFEIVEMILAIDLRMLLLSDSRGSVPLSYVRQEHWEEWVAWIRSKLDVYWPKRDVARAGPETAPPLTLQPPNIRPIRDPPNGLTTELAAMVVSGRIKPHEAEVLKNDRSADDVTAEESDWDSDEDTDDDSEYDDDSELGSESEYSESECSIDEEDMALIFNNLAVTKEF